MSSTLTGPYPPVLVRADEAEHLDLIGHVLLADSSATAGALSSHRVALGRGADGAVPHRHDHSSELFYILDGAFDLLVADTSSPRAPAICWSFRLVWRTRSPRTTTRPPRR